MAKPSKKMEIKEAGLQDHYIFHPATIEKIYSRENAPHAADCMALYVFFVKTSKWQKTNKIKCTDTYIKKSLNWGATKTNRTKQLLLNMGLVDPVVRRDDSGKIKGYYLQINFLISASELHKQTEKEGTDMPENKQQESPQTASQKASIQSTQNPRLDEPTSGFQDTDALRLKVNMLKDFNKKMLKEKEAQEKESKPEPKPSSVKKTKTQKNYKFSDDDYQTAKFIYLKILGAKPDFKRPNSKAWSNEIRLMRERDGRTRTEIEELFAWGNADGFWCSNLLSPQKLRKHWDQLWLQRDRQQAKTKTSYSSAKANNHGNVDSEDLDWVDQALGEINEYFGGEQL